MNIRLKASDHMTSVGPSVRLSVKRFIFLLVYFDFLSVTTGPISIKQSEKHAWVKEIWVLTE